jgi:DNA/RNA endonuclease YhcR with UshA esterase domain
VAWSSDGDRAVLHFQGREGEAKLTGVIFKRSRETMETAFGGDLSAALSGAVVRVLGRVSVWSGQAQIVIDSPSQIELMQKAASPAEVVDADEPAPRLASGDTPALQAAEGQEAVVYGVVRSADWVSSGAVLILRFADTSEDGYTGVVFRDNAPAIERKMGGDLGDILPGRTVELRGRIALYRERPQTVIRDARQITLLDETADAPPPAMPDREMDRP